MFPRALPIHLFTDTFAVGCIV